MITINRDDLSTVDVGTIVNRLEALRADLPPIIFPLMEQEVWLRSPLLVAGAKTEADMLFNSSFVIPNRFMPASDAAHYVLLLSDINPEDFRTSQPVRFFATYALLDKDWNLWIAETRWSHQPISGQSLRYQLCHFSPPELHKGGWALNKSLVRVFNNYIGQADQSVVVTQILNRLMWLIDKNAAVYIGNARKCSDARQRVDGAVTATNEAALQRLFAK